MKPSIRIFTHLLAHNSRLVLTVYFTVTLVLSALLAKSNWDSFQTISHSRHEKTVQDFNHAFELYLHPLQGIVAAFHLSDLKVSTKSFRESAESRDLFKNFKGALGFGFIRRVEADQLSSYLEKQRDERPWFELRRLRSEDFIDRPNEYFIIEDIEPVERNEKAVGLVVSDESRRREAAIRSMETGQPAVTQSIQLVQADRTEAGFLYYLPIYRTPIAPDTVQGRIKNFVGWAYAPLLVGEIVEFVRLHNQNFLPFKVSEVIEDEGEYETLFLDPEFDENGWKLLTFESSVMVGGRLWKVTSGVSVDHWYKVFSWSLVGLAVGLLLSLFVCLWLLRIREKLAFDAELIRKTTEEVAERTKDILEQQRFLQSLVDGLPTIVVYLNRDLTIKLNNKASRILRFGIQQSKDRGAPQ